MFSTKLNSFSGFTKFPSGLWSCTTKTLHRFLPALLKNLSLLIDLFAYLEIYIELKMDSQIGDNRRWFSFGDWCFSKSLIGHLITNWWFPKTPICHSKSPIDHFITNWWSPLLVYIDYWAFLHIERMGCPVKILSFQRCIQFW